MLRPIRLVPDNTKIPFMKYGFVGFTLTSLTVVLSLVAYLTLGLNYGIDFQGGTMIEIRTQGPADLADLRDKMNNLDLGSTELQEFGEPNDVLIRIQTQPGGEAAQQGAIQKVKDALGTDVEYRRIEVVGPKVSGELTRNGIIAVVVAIVGIMIYIWVRFEWQFSISTMATLVHDVALTIGLFSVLQLEFNLSIIAAILTIVGYSLNDTVVVFDRVRENLRKFKKMPLVELVDLSLNQTLARTVMTSSSTLIALFALYIFGGEVLSGFTLAMIWGVVVGTYSTIYVSTPALLYLNLRSIGAKAEAREQAGREAPPAVEGPAPESAPGGRSGAGG